MKNFIKQNKLLSVVVAGTALISLILIFLIIRINLQRGTSLGNLDNLKEKISRLNRRKPYPSEANINGIKSDISKLEEQITGIRQVFGNIYAIPLNAFIEELNKAEIANLVLEESKEDKPEVKKDLELRINKLKSLNKIELFINFQKSWNAFLEKQKEREYGVSLSELLETFRVSKKYSVEDFKNAVDVFKTTLQKYTLDDVTAENVEDYLLHALGIKLNFTRVRCKTFVVSIEKALNHKLNKANIHIPSNRLILFNEFRTVPNDDQIPYIIQYTSFLEDFYSRLIDSNIVSIISYRKINDLKGLDKNDFSILKYEVVVVAPQKSLRNFLNSLQTAYKDNRIYKILSLTFVKIEDEVQNITPFNRSVDRLSEQVKILLGTSDLVKATIQVEYIIYKMKPAT